MDKLQSLFSSTYIDRSTWQQLAGSLLIIAAILIAYLFEQHVANFDFYRSAIHGGEYWRLFTGHLFHTNGIHLLLNIAGLALITALHRHFYCVSLYAALIIFSMLFISLYLLVFGDLSHYVGLSGVLHSLFAWGALKDVENNEKTGIFLFLGLWVKVMMEQTQGASDHIATLIDASVAIDAHLSGAIAGTLFFALSYFAHYLKKFNKRV
ncbi:rhombosortase [Thalassotalea euphylliae]|uniref:rhombosortase n=1 Tax=Thalassotalea euphylliae TaxID=1655234 RepID=UPI0021624F16|nr:rhombosortase [Thalassotalea euphylliae]